MKKIFKLLTLVLLIGLLFTGCARREQDEVVVNNNDALIWQVTDTDGNSMYLVGSIHVGKKSMFPLPEKLLKAFKESDALAVEVNINEIENDEEYIAAMTEVMFLTDSSLEDYVAEEDVDALNEKLELIAKSTGIPTETLTYLHPAMVTSFLDELVYEELGYKAKYGVDQYFLDEAEDKNMEIIEIENGIDQLNMLFNFSDAIQKMLIKSSLNITEEDKKVLEEMVSLYNLGDTDKFDKFMSDMYKSDTENMSKAEKKLYDSYSKIMEDDRNILMVEKIEELLKTDKKVFYIVGSAHYFGDTGILKLLEDKGYTVTDL